MAEDLDKEKQKKREQYQLWINDNIIEGKNFIKAKRYRDAWNRLVRIYDFNLPCPELEPLLIQCEQAMGWPKRAPELVEMMKRYLGCPGRLFDPQPDAHLHMAAYKRAWKSGQKKGFVPVFVSVNNLEHLMEMLVENADPEAKRMEDFSVERVQRYRKELLSKPLPDGTDVLKSRVSSMDLEEEANWFGSLPTGGGIHNEFLSLFHTGEGTKQVILAKIPVKNPWEVFAWLPMGSWNAAPDPLEMMEVAKSWYERFGAVPAAVSGDEVEFYMETPAGRNLTNEELKGLAMEHHAFAPDTWEGIIDTSTLKRCRYWYFWWD